MFQYRNIAASIGLSILALANAQTKALPPDFITFWHNFRAAVISEDVEKVIEMIRLPLPIPNQAKKIRTSKDIVENYAEIFSKLTDASKCFKRTRLKDIQENDTNEYFVNCPDEDGDDVISYSFLLTSEGWKFIQLDDL